MNIIVHNSKCKGEIVIPPSKSDMHRAIISASLSKGKSVIENVTKSLDIETTINAFKALGASITFSNNTLFIEGIDFNNIEPSEIDCNESGSTLRFLIPILSVFNKPFKLKGAKKLLSRPLSVYEKIFNDQNLKFNLNEDYLEIEGKIKPNEYIIEGDISSQFVSGLLFSLPLLDKDSIIKVKEPFESESYVNMTLRTLSKFGINIKRVNKNEFYVYGNQEYKACNYKVEADFSQFGFYAVLGALNNDLVCKGLNFDSCQGDKVILDILTHFGVKYEIKNDEIKIYKCSELSGSFIDLKDCIDLGPIVMVLSLFSEESVRIINTRRLLFKESNRVDAIVSNFIKLGANIDVDENEVIIHPALLTAKDDVVLDSFNDHRVMMALVVLSSVLNDYTIISDANCVKKSYVNFYKDMLSVGIEVGLHN